MARSSRGRGILPALVAVVLAGGAISACGSDSSGGAANSSGGSSKKTYTIATTNDLSGSLAVLGKPYVSGLRTYIDYKNAQGGVNGHKLKLSVLDDGGQPDRGVTNVKQLLNQHPIGFLSHVGSAVQLPVQDLLDAAKTPTFAYVAVEQLITRPYNFAVGISSTDNYLIEANYIGTLNPSAKPKVAMFVINTPAQVVARDNVIKSMKAKGWNVVANETYEAGATDVSSQMQRIRKANPDYILAGVLNDIAPNMLNELKTLGVKAPVVNFSPGSADSVFKAIGTDQFLALRDLVSPNDPSSTTGKTLVAAADKYGAADDANQVIFTKGWVAGEVYAEALSKCGDTCTGESVTKAIEGISALDIGDLGPKLDYTATHAGTRSARVYGWDAASGTAKPKGDYISAATQ